MRRSIAEPSHFRKHRTSPGTWGIVGLRMDSLARNRTLLVSFGLVLIVAVFLITSVGSGEALQLAECEQYPLELANYERSERYSCYSERIREATKERGVAPVVAAFGQYLASDEGKKIVGPTCHVLAHVIGETAVDTNVESAEILTTCGNFCAGGCLNGAAHNYILNSGEVADAEKFCNSSSVDDEVRRACYHGIGHGLTEFLQWNVEKGLTMCDDLADETGRTECAHAVLMDFEALAAMKKPPVPSDMLAFCSRLSALYKETCYEFSGMLTYARSREPHTSLALCERVPATLMERCTNRVMEVVLQTTPREKRVEVVQELCGTLDREKIRRCYFGAVVGTLYTIGTTPGEQSAAFCEAAPDWLKEECYQTLAQSLEREFGKENRDAFCAARSSECD